MRGSAIFTWTWWVNLYLARAAFLYSSELLPCLARGPSMPVLLFMGWRGCKIRESTLWLLQVFTLTCLTVLFTLSLEPWRAYLMIPLEETVVREHGQQRVKTPCESWTVTVLLLSNVYNIYVGHKQLSFSHLLFGQRRGWLR